MYHKWRFVEVCQNTLFCNTLTIKRLQLRWLLELKISSSRLDFHNSHKHSTVRPESSADSTTAFPPPPVWTSDIIDGATSYCRSKQNWNAQHCDDFDKCCKLHCYGNAAEPTCSSSSENATAIYQDQAFCRCTHQTYLSNSNITKSCMHSDDCVTFHMCCLLEGCPSTYVRCESSTYDKKPTKGVCFC